MKWVTRECARVDRIACPWLIARFIDPSPRFLFVPAGDVAATARREGAEPFDVPGVALGHHRARCSFDAFLEHYELDEPALAVLAGIVRGADTDDRALAPESAGLYAAATGFQAISRDDHDNMAHQFPLYDALYAFCRDRIGAAAPRPRVVFVCLHGAAKSVVAAAHFRREAAARGLAIDAVAVGTEPEPALAPGAVKGLAGEGLEPPLQRPRMVTLHDVATATQVVTFGCDLSAWHPASPVASWEEVPAVSDGYENARNAIAARVAALAGSLADAARHG